MTVSRRGDSSSREREKESDGIWDFTKETRNGASQNIPGKGTNPFKKQTLLSLDSSFLLFYFLWACEYTSFIKLEMVRWREKGRRGGRQAGGNERLYPLTISAVTGLPAPEGEGGAGGRGGGVPRQRKVPAPLHKEGRGRLLSENRETDFGGDVRNGASAFYGLCQVAQGAGARVPVLSVIGEAGNEQGAWNSVGRATFEGHEQEKEQGGTCKLGILGEEDIVFYVCMVSYGLQNTDRSTRKPHRDWGGQHIIMTVQVKKLSPRIGDMFDHKNPYMGLRFSCSSYCIWAASLGQVCTTWVGCEGLCQW